MPYSIFAQAVSGPDGFMEILRLLGASSSLGVVFILLYYGSAYFARREAERIAEQEKFRQALQDQADKNQDRLDEQYHSAELRWDKSHAEFVVRLEAQALNHRNETREIVTNFAKTTEDFRCEISEISRHNREFMVETNESLLELKIAFQNLNEEIKDGKKIPPA